VAERGRVGRVLFALQHIATPTKTNRTTLQAQRSANKGSNMIQDASLWMEYDGILDADG
jgi:hypothetical protein